MKDELFFKEIGITHEKIYDGRILHVYRDDVTLPNGKKSMREYCIHNGAVAVVALTAENEVICVRQYRYAIGRVTVEIPAGKLDSVSEEPLLAAERELREETGCTAGKITYVGGLNTSPAILSETIHMYLAEELNYGECDPDEDEFLEIIKIPLEKMVDMIINGEIMDSKTQAAVLKVWAMKQKKK